MLGVEHLEVQPPQVSPLLWNKDLFDAEDSDSDVDYTARSPTPPLEEVVSPPPDRHGSPLLEDGAHKQDEGERSSGHSDVEEENESVSQRQKSPGSKGNGAKSSIAQSRTRRVPKVDAKKIHSESQRIIRESDLSLPYHKPKPLSLNDFFSKKPSKTGVLSVKALKGLSKRQQIAVLTQRQTDTASHETNGRAASSQPSPRAVQHPRPTDALSQGPRLMSNEPEAENGRLSCDGIPAVEESGQEIRSEEEHGSPLRLEESSDEGEKTDAPQDANLSLQFNAEMDDAAAMDTVSAEETPSLDETSPKMIRSDDAMKEEPVLAPDNDENMEVAQLSIDDVERGKPNHPHCDAAAMATTAEKDEDADFNLRLSPSQTPTSYQRPASGQPHRRRLLEASLPKLKTLTPRLSGEAEQVVDLGDDDSDAEEAGSATPGNPGLNRLMERFVRHTARSTPRPRTEVNLSVVSKETGTDGKEDLKLGTVAVTIEGEECDDPSLKVPGAKLLKLKESLQVKMRARREVERRRRKEAYRLDNEDYNEDEEGEMTDGSDTDDESGGDAAVGGGKEKKMKTNAFVRHEAAVDDDDDDDYDPEEDSDEYEDGTDSDNDDEKDAASNRGNGGREPEDGADLQIYSAETDEEVADDDDDDDGEETIKRVSSVGKAKKKRLFLDDDDEEEEEEVERGGTVARQHETANSPMLELHLDADDEGDENEEKMHRDDSLTDTRTKNKALTPNVEMDNQSFVLPRPDAALPVRRLLTESVSSHDGTVDSCDVDGLGESIMRAARSPRKALVLEEKTRDLFESASNTDGGTTGSSEVDRAGDSFAGRTNFSWSALKRTRGAVPDDSSREFPRQVDNSSNSLDTSFELVGSVIPAHQPGGGLMRRNGRKASVEDGREGFTPFANHHGLLQGAPKSSKLSELTLPVEDSQDLFRVDTPSLTVAMETQPGGDTQSFRFSYDDDETQTQFLDENGFLKLRSTSKPKTATKSLFEDENGSPDQMDELLGLCSGKFGNGPGSSSKIRKGLFSQLSSQRVGGDQGNLDELLGLCSGTFASHKEDSQAKSLLPIDSDTHGESSFHIVSDDEGNRSDGDHQPVLSDDEGFKPKKRKRIRLMDDADSDEDGDEDDAEEEQDLDEEEEEMLDSEDELSMALVQEKSTNKKLVAGKSLKIRSKVSKDFLDEEAELSGSEYESDEDYDAEDLPDELEQSEADKENVGTEEQLREQVNKVHMKTMEDDDARRLRLYKEMYLPDGDLYSEGKGRTRQFRWRHNDDDSQLNLFPGNSDDEGDEDKDEDTQWRRQRFQREQWLIEQKEKQTAKEASNTNDADDDDVVEENSQFGVFMKTAVNRKRKADPIPAIVDGDKPVPKEKEQQPNSSNPVKFRHGSFLKRSKGDLAKIASMMKPATNSNAPRVSRSVLYQAIAPQAEEEDDKKPQLRRSTSDSPGTRAPKAKRPRLDRSQSLAKPSSIFSLM